MTRWILIAALGLVACDAEERGKLTIAGADGSVDDTDVPAVVDPATCANPLVRTDPDDGSTGVSLGASIQAVLSAAEPDVRLRLRSDDRDVGGRTVPGDDEASWRFSPVQPVRANTDYSLSVQWSCGTEVVSWRTGAEVSRITPASGSVALPETELALNAVLSPWLVQVDALGGGGVQLLTAPARGPTQDACEPSAVLLGDLSADGQFDVDAPSMVWGVGNQRTVARNVRAVGEIDLQRGDVIAMSVTARIDLRPMVMGLLGDQGTLQQACAELPAGCALCLDGQAACVDVRIEALGIDDTAADVSRRTPDDIAMDEACQP